MKKSNKASKIEIYQAIRRDIITGRYAPDDRLEVDALAERFGTSISPIRDALQMLGQDYLVTIRPRTGYFVTRMTLKRLRDLLELREVLEMAAIERAADRVTEELLDSLESEKNEKMDLDKEDPDYLNHYIDANRNFHVRLAEASGNKELAEQVGQLMDRLARFMVIDQSRIMEGFHHKIIETLRQADLEAAKTAMFKDLSASRRKILDRVMEKEAENWVIN